MEIFLEQSSLQTLHLFLSSIFSNLLTLLNIYNIDIMYFLWKSLIQSE